jgi:hypothetical protein
LRDLETGGGIVEYENPDALCFETCEYDVTMANGDQWKFYTFDAGCDGSVWAFGIAT